MSRFARRTDSNHAEIVAGLRQCGVAVLDLHALPGALDALCGFRGRLTLLEIKDGAKSASRKRLTPAELATVELFALHGCSVAVVDSLDAALKVLGAT